MVAGVDGDYNNFVCPQDVRLNGMSVPLLPDSDASHGLPALDPPVQTVNVEPGEKSDAVCAATTPCLNGGVCTDVFFDDFQ